MTTRPRIAVVDDDRVYTEMIRDLLDGEGYDMIVILDATDAAVTIARACPALVLLDVRMDGPETGVEILTSLRANPATANLPVIVCAADQLFLRSHATYLESQNAASVAKPFDLDDLLNIIERTLGDPLVS